MHPSNQIPSLGTVKAHIQPDEVTLIERVLNREQECFYELVRPYERSIYVSASLPR
jgi:hypothetical protein